MRNAPTSSVDVARALLDHLRCAREATAGRSHGYAIDAIQALGRLHARTIDGQLSPTVYGQDFR